jgi:hypothetical protein
LRPSWLHDLPASIDQKEDLRGPDVPNTSPKRTQIYLFHCDQCLRSFTRAFALRVHLWVHAGEQPFRCRACSRVFTRAYDCKPHQELHDERTKEEFPCPSCGRCFSRMSNLDRHHRTNMGKHCLSMLLDEGDDEEERTDREIVTALSKLAREV